MYSSTIYSVITAALISFAGAQNTTLPVTGELGNATVVKDNPVGVVYKAFLPPKQNTPLDGQLSAVKGLISATAGHHGVGVEFSFEISGLPTSGGPFLYHIHVDPVPEDGNCTKTLAHLDPFIRGETPACDPTLPETCQVGDLSGKHGKITSDPFTASYTDKYASTKEGIGAFFGNRSIVVHYANKTRISCANFLLEGTSNGTSPNSTAPIIFSGGSSKTAISTLVALVVLVGLGMTL